MGEQNKNPGAVRQPHPTIKIWGKERLLSPEREAERRSGESPRYSRFPFSSWSPAILDRRTPRVLVIKDSVLFLWLKLISVTCCTQRTLNNINEISLVDLLHIMWPHWENTGLLKSFKMKDILHINYFRAIELFSELPQNTFSIII